VVLQTPDAGWAPQYSGIKDMTWLQQQSLPKSGPRRGAQLVATHVLRIRKQLTLTKHCRAAIKDNIIGA